MAEKRAGQTIDRVAEIGVIKDVEELCAETEAPVLGKVKLLLQADVRLCGAETAEHIAAEISLLPCRRSRKSRGVENLAAGILRAKEIERHSRVYVGAGREGGAIGEIN